MDSKASPALFFETLNAYQRTEALRAAIQLDLFSKIDAAGSDSPILAQQMGCSERGTRMLCDYLVIIGFLEKRDSIYIQTPTAAAFLDRRSPQCMSSAMDFLLAPNLIEGFQKLSEAVRTGTTQMSTHGTMDPEHPVWERFAQSMGPMAALAAKLLAARVTLPKDRASRVLDVSASHGLYGIEVARHFPQAQITAVDWPAVVAVAAQNAATLQVADRFHALPGNVFDVDLGAEFDAILLPNFLHHFDAATCTTLLTKLCAATRPGGSIYVLEFIPNADRVSPPSAAMFALTMLATTKSGDAYTRVELESMLHAAGYRNCESYSLAPTIHDAIVAVKPK